MTGRSLLFSRRTALLLLLLVIFASLPTPQLATPARAQPAAPAAAPAAPPKKQVYLPSIQNVAQPTAQELIAEARRRGQIDYGTSLLYRTYAYFGDKRLPAALRGSGSAREDNALFTEVLAPAKPLSADLQAKLRPFTVRPHHADSIYSSAFRAARAGQQAAPLAAPAPGALPCDANGWSSRQSASVPVKVWALCSVDTPVGDGSATGDIDMTINLIEKYYGAMTKLMGLPREDLGTPDAGGSKAIDIYLLYHGEFVVRAGHQRNLEANQAGAVLLAQPFLGRKSSGYMLLSRDRMGQDYFVTDLVHEFFHVLTKAHNSHLEFRQDPSDPTGESYHEYWFVEASAEWAVTHFVPEQAGSEVHYNRFPRDFQIAGTNKSLHAREPGGSPFMYAAYIWPFFMAQQGGPGKIAETWKALELAGTWEEADKKIDAQLPFEKNFRTFALRNINTELLPGDPISPRYKHHVESYFAGPPPPNAQFPDGKQPFYLDGITLKPGGRLPVKITLKALNAQYEHYTVDPSVGKVRLELSQMTNIASFNWDLVIKPRGKPWSILPLGQKTRFILCDVEEFWVVLSDHAIDMSKRVDGLLDIKPEADPCRCEAVSEVLAESITRGWTGKITASWSDSASESFSWGGKHDARASHSFNVAITFDKHISWPDRPGFHRWIADNNGTARDITGSALIDDMDHYYGGAGVPTLNKWQSIGAGAEDAYVNLMVDLNTCTYSLQVGVETMITKTGDPEPYAAWVALFELTDIPIPQDAAGTDPGTKEPRVTLTGGRQLPYGTKVNEFNPGANSAIGSIPDIKGDNQVNSASISWTLEAPGPRKPGN